MKRTLATILIVAIPIAANAARPFVTDDARLTTAGSCQLESWMRIYPGSKEIWALPACNPTGYLEFTFGGGKAKNDNEAATHDYIFQLKTIIKPLNTNGFGWGLAFGTVRHPENNQGPNLLGNTYAYIPLSMSFNNDDLIVHTNIGWLKDKQTGRNNATWGVGGEYKLTSRLLAISEVFGDNHQKPYWQVGTRYSIIPDKFQIDATIGQQISASTDYRWISFGIRITPDSLF